MYKCYYVQYNRNDNAICNMEDAGYMPIIVVKVTIKVLSDIRAKRTIIIESLVIS